MNGLDFSTSWDDGSVYDKKLAMLLLNYDLPATFYMPVHCDIGLYWVRDIAKVNKKFEIGCHTVTHPQDLKDLDYEFLDFEVRIAKEMLEIVVEKPVTKFCYPRGRYNDFVKDMVKTSGFKEARTTEVLRVDRNFDVFEKPTTIHAYQRNEYKGQDWLEVGKELFDKAKNEDGYYHLWGHSAEVEKNNDWERLEKLFKYISENL